MTLTASGVVDDYTTDVQRALLDELCVIIGVSCDGVTLHVQPASVRLHVRFPVASAASAASLELSLLHEVGSAEQATRWLRQAGLTQAVVESPPFFELSQPAAPSPPLGRDGGGGGIGGLVGGGAGVGALLLAVIAFGVFKRWRRPHSKMQGGGSEGGGSGRLRGHVHRMQLASRLKRRGLGGRSDSAAEPVAAAAAEEEEEEEEEEGQLGGVRSAQKAVAAKEHKAGGAEMGEQVSRQAPRQAPRQVSRQASRQASRNRSPTGLSQAQVRIHEGAAVAASDVQGALSGVDSPKSTASGSSSVSTAMTAHAAPHPCPRPTVSPSSGATPPCHGDAQSFVAGKVRPERLGCVRRDFKPASSKLGPTMPTDGVAKSSAVSGREAGVCPGAAHEADRGRCSASRASFTKSEKPGRAGRSASGRGAPSQRAESWGANPDLVRV